MPAARWLPDTLVQAMDRVESALDQPWPLERFAAAASFSPFHFHRLFRDACGETPAAFVERLRLERAALLLLAAETPITELAYDLGFQNPETFARRFRNRFLVSAREYRAQQLEAWARLDLEAGVDPMPGAGEIRVERLDVEPLEVRRRMGAETPFDFGDPDGPWSDGSTPAPLAARYGLTLDWPGITPEGWVRQDWGRPLGDRAVAPGWVRRADLAGTYATLAVRARGPLPNTVYQRLYVWSLAGRHRLRPGPIVEIARGDEVVACQPVFDIEEGVSLCSSIR